MAVLSQDVPKARLDGAEVALSMAGVALGDFKVPSKPNQSMRGFGHH